MLHLSPTTPLPQTLLPENPHPVLQSRQPKALGFRLSLQRQLPGPRKAGSSVGGAPLSRWGAAAWSGGQGRTVDDPSPWCSRAGAARASPVRAPDPGRAPKLRSQGLSGPRPAQIGTSPLPRALTWLGRPGSLPWPEWPWRLRPGKASGWFWRLLAVLSLSPGVGDPGRERGGQSRRLRPQLPTRPALLSSSFRRRLAMNSRCGPPVSQGAHRGRAGPLCPHPPPQLLPCSSQTPTRENCVA